MTTFRPLPEIVQEERLRLAKMNRDPIVECVLLKGERDESARLAELGLKAIEFLRTHVNASKEELDALRKEFGLGRA